MATTPPLSDLTPVDRAYEDIRGAYRKYLGRDPDDAEIRSHLGNNRQYSPQNINYAVGNISRSPEALTWAQKQTEQRATDARLAADVASGAWNTQVGIPNPNTAAATNRPPSTGQWAGGNYAYTGFNTARPQDVSKSAKDAFAYATALAERAGAGNQWHTKQGAEQFATLYVKPYLEQQGFKVLGIVGDQINIVTREDEAAGNTAGSWFDFVVNADGANPMLAWQIQSGTGYGGFGGTPATLPPATTPPTTTPPVTPPASTPPPGIDPRAYENLVPPPAATYGGTDPYSPPSMSELI
jgi:hypothetical protein